MVKKLFSYRGKSLEELRELSLAELATIMPARIRRSLRRGLDRPKAAVIAALEAGKVPRVQAREMPVLPVMVGKLLKVHNGKEWVTLTVLPEMLGHMLGEFALTRKKVVHSTPGIGATRSTDALSVK